MSALRKKRVDFSLADELMIIRWLEEGTNYHNVYHGRNKSQAFRELAEHLQAKNGVERGAQTLRNKLNAMMKKFEKVQELYGDDNSRAETEFPGYQSFARLAAEEGVPADLDDTVDFTEGAEETAVASSERPGPGSAPRKRRRRAASLGFLDLETNSGADTTSRALKRYEIETDKGLREKAHALEEKKYELMKESNEQDLRIKTDTHTMNSVRFEQDFKTKKELDEVDIKLKNLECSKLEAEIKRLNSQEEHDEYLRQKQRALIDKLTASDLSSEVLAQFLNALRK